MKVVVISNPSDTQENFARAKALGYITFIYHYADPTHTLSPHKFAYVHTDEELKEKIQLLAQDITIQEEVLRW